MNPDETRMQLQLRADAMRRADENVSRRHWILTCVVACAGAGLIYWQIKFGLVDGSETILFMAILGGLHAVSIWASRVVPRHYLLKSALALLSLLLVLALLPFSPWSYKSEVNAILTASFASLPMWGIAIHLYWTQHGASKMRPFTEASKGNGKGPEPVFQNAGSPFSDASLKFATLAVLSNKEYLEYEALRNSLSCDSTAFSRQLNDLLGSGLVGIRRWWPAGDAPQIIQISKEGMRLYHSQLSALSGQH